MRIRRAGLIALACWAFLALPRGAAAAAVCDAATALTTIGMDTVAGQILLAVPPTEGSAGAKGPKGSNGWVVVLAGDAASATLYPDLDAGGKRLGGSVGPGAVLAAHPCGDSCLQPVRWSAGSWELLGEPIQVPAVITTTGTWDLSGTPWIVVHGAGKTAGQVQAWAFRLDGREWKLAGAMPVAAVGDLEAVPAPQRRDGVVSGTGLFSASAAAGPWVVGLPDLPPARQGQVIGLGAGAAAYLSADGVVYLSQDDGKAWRRSTWTPWGAGTTGMWRQGTDYWVDLPLGDRRGPLELAWFDRRVANDERLYLTRLTPGGEWLTLAQAKSEITTRNDHLAVSHVFAPTPDTWIVLSGCVATAEGSSLVVRVYEKGALSAPRLVPLREAGGS